MMQGIHFGPARIALGCEETLDDRVSGCRIAVDRDVVTVVAEIRGDSSYLRERGVPGRLKTAKAWVRRIETAIASAVALLDVDTVAWKRGGLRIDARVVVRQVT